MTWESASTARRAMVRVASSVVDVTHVYCLLSCRWLEVLLRDMGISIDGQKSYSAAAIRLCFLHLL